MTGTWNCSANNPKVGKSTLATFVQKKCTGELKFETNSGLPSVYTVCGHTITLITQLLNRTLRTYTGEVNESVTEMKWNSGMLRNSVCRKVSGK